MPFTATQQAQFRQQGFLLLPQVLPASALAPLRDEIGARVEAVAAAAVRSGQLVGPSSGRVEGAEAATFADAPLDNRLALLAGATADAGWVWREHGSNIYGKPLTAGMLSIGRYRSFII